MRGAAERVRRSPTAAATWVVAAWWAVGASASFAAAVPLRACPVSQPGCGVGTTALPLAPTVAVVVGVGSILTGAWWWRRRAATGAGGAEGAVAAPAPTGARLRGRRWLGGLGVVVALAGAHLLLVADIDESRPCETPVRLNEWMGYALNCDSPLFMHMASFPDSVLQEGNARQSRPVFVLVSAVTTRVVAPLADLAGATSLYGVDHEAHLPLVLLALAATAGAIAAAAWLLSRWGAPAAISGAVGAVLAVNTVTRQFTWSPHTQTLNLLVPMLSVLAVRHVLLRRPGSRGVAGLGLLLGLGMLVYGATLVVLLATALGLLLGGLRRGTVHVLVLGATCALPVLGWVAWCELATGSFTSAETAGYRQFVWIVDAARVGLPELWDRSSSYWSLTVDEVVQAGWPVVVAVGALAAAAVAAGARLHVDDDEERATLVALGLTILSAVVFLWAMGYYVPRLAWTLLAPLLVLGGWFATRLAERSPKPWVPAACVVAAGAWVVHATFVAGPPIG